MEVRSEDLDTEQDISSEEGEDELDMNEEYFFGKDKEAKWRGNPVRKQIRKHSQNILCQLPLVQANQKMPRQNLKLVTALSQMIL